MKRYRKALLASAIVIFLSAAFGLLVLESSMITRVTYEEPKTSYQNWDDIFEAPKAISIQTFSTGTMETNLSGIMNLKHERAKDIEDVIVDIPVNVSIINHKEHGSYLVDAGLDASYISNAYGSSKGMLVRKISGKGSQEANTDIASILKNKNIQLQGVWLTHLHPDHTAGIIDLPKNIPYVAGKGERYINFRFFMETNHLKGIDKLYEIDFTEGVELAPFGKCVDLFGDGSFWAIESSGHSKGHVMFIINGIDEKVLVTGDACNDQYQFDMGIGPGYFSSDRDKAQKVLEDIILFKEQYPNVRLVFGHDLL